MPRRILHQVFHGSTHSTSHFIRSRLTRRTPAPFPGDHYGPNLERLSSSVHVVINGRAGLFRDVAEVTPRDGDVLPPFRYDPERPRRVDSDPRRLP